MAKRAVVAALVALALSGCGTVYDNCRMSPWGETCRVYGGVRADAEQIKVSSARVAEGSAFDIVQVGTNLLDMPLSALADTLLLPMTIPHSHNVASLPESPPARSLPAETPSP